MKHIFVINPAAGKTNVTEALLPRLRALFVGREEELETYLTTGVGCLLYTSPSPRDFL